LLKVNMQYIASAAMDDKYRTEPPFKLQGSYRNMNKMAEKIVAAMTPEEVDRLVDDHYQGEAQTLTIAAEQNLLKLAEMRGRLNPTQAERWATIKREFQRTRSLGGAEDDPAVRIGGQLSILAQRVESITDALKTAASRGPSEEAEEAARAQQTRMMEMMALMQQQVAAAREKPAEKPPEKALAPPTIAAGPLEWARPQIARIANALETLGQSSLAIEVKNEAPPGITELLAQQVAIIERTLVPLVRAATGNLQDMKSLELRVDQMLGMLQEIDEGLKAKFAR
ncbi:MAG TPA: DNA repair protein, partial [Nannocystis sp.]